MQLTENNIHQYLISRGFMSSECICRGDYVVVPSQTRNHIFNVITKKGPSLFVKKINTPEPTNLFVLQKDATCLWLIKNEEAFHKVSEYVPKYFGFDPEHQILVTELLLDSQNLHEYSVFHKKLGTKVIQSLAKLMSSLHFKLNDEIESSNSFRFFPREIPWVLNLTELNLPDQVQSLTLTPYPNPVIPYVNNHTTLKNELRNVRKEWAPVCLIHGDIKWTNILVQDVDGKPVLKLIDWEMADVGDPIWDVAGVVQNLLADELIYYKDPNSGLLYETVISLSDMDKIWGSVKKFLDAYKKKMHFQWDDENRFYHKVLSFTAGRLVQSAVEHNLAFTEIHNNASIFLQTSALLFDNIQLLIEKIR